MPQQLEEMHEDDTFLEHLEGLKEHPGWLAYQAWVDRQLARNRKEIEEATVGIEATSFLRGCIHNAKLCKNALQILIDEHTDKLKEVRK